MSFTYPTAELTWQFNVNQIAGLNISAIADNRDVMYKIKNTLCSFESNPWTVVSSSNATSYGNTDYWTSNSSLNWNFSGSARSWIVLRNIGGSELCIDLMYGGLPIYFVGNIYFSNSEHFSGGSTTARPTATDEVRLLYNNNYKSDSATYGQLGIQNAATTGKLHVLHSEDGYHTRIIYFQQNTPTLFAMVSKVTPQSNITWTTPNIACWLGLSTITSVITHTLLNTNYMIDGYYNGQINLSASVESFASSASVANITMMNNTNPNYWLIAPILGLWCSDSLNYGKFAMPSQAGYSAIPDLFWGSSSISSGTGFINNSGQQNWIQLGHLIFPWNNTYIQKA